MIKPIDFLGMPMGKKRNRRWLVTGYYLAMGVCGTLFSLSGPKAGFLLPSMIAALGFLGGIRTHGPVKTYSSRYVPLGESADGTLSLMRSSPLEEDDQLDERDYRQRDHAHYLAMSVLRVVSVACAILLGLVGSWGNSNLLLPLFIGSGYAILLLVLTLPQAILLWTEPDVELE